MTKTFQPDDLRQVVKASSKNTKERETGPYRAPFRASGEGLSLVVHSAAAARHAWHGRGVFFLFDDQRFGGEEQTGD